MSIREVTVALAIFLSGGGLSAQQLVGYWIGNLADSTPKDGAKRLVLQANSDDKQRVVFYSIDQDREPWTPDSVSVEGGQIKVELDGGRARFLGIVGPGGRTITGTWSENGLPPRPLILSKEPRVAAWGLIQPSQEDLQVVAKAKELLNRPEKWDRQDTDDHKCNANSKAFTLYCAFEVATKQVFGGFDHRDTALEEARFVIESRGKHYRHRLLGFNNDPAVTFGMLQNFFDQVSRRVTMDVQDAKAADAASQIVK